MISAMNSKDIFSDHQGREKVDKTEGSRREIMPLISISPLDEERFGIITGKVFLKDLEQVSTIFIECNNNNVKLLIARSYVSDIRIAQELEKKGGFITDTLVYYKYDLLKNIISEDKEGVEIRPVNEEEFDSVKKVAERSFKGYFGHYHADNRLLRKDCDDVYTDWAFRSCVERKETTEVLAAIDAKSIVGFATMRLNTAEEGEGVLFGVDPAAQGRGVYRSFIIAGLNWCKQKGCSSMVVSTQINNIAVQKVWVRAGFEPLHAYYTFHKWFD
jgi:ribosomal protein S18 acetylase RimI-like enzyme